MPFRRLSLTVLSSALTIVANACSADQCSMGHDYCDGNVAWVCNGGGDKGPLVWESQKCEDGSTCFNGACFTDPLMPCSASEIGQWTCTPDRRYIGLCSPAGYWGWDTSHSCEAARQEICQEAQILQDGQALVLAQCVLTPVSKCPPESSNPTCVEDAVTDCTSIGYRARVRDCAAAGLVCRKGECVPVL